MESAPHARPAPRPWQSDPRPGRGPGPRTSPSRSRGFHLFHLDFAPGLPAHAFDTKLAYNTRHKRGLRWWGRASAVRREAAQRGAAAAQPAAAVAGNNASGDAGTLRLLRGLMAPSVRSLDALLRGAKRAGVPRQWLQGGGAAR